MEADVVLGKLLTEVCGLQSSPSQVPCCLHAQTGS